MDEWEAELAATTKKMHEAEALLASRREYRDRQLLAIVGTEGVTWRSLQAITGLSPRGLQMALERARQA